MRLNLSFSEVETLARRYYPGASTPLSYIKADDRPDECDWWQSKKTKEQFKSQRHVGALKLYLELARGAVTKLPQNTFPARFEPSDANPLRPDKGFIKMCLNAEPALLLCSSDNGILLFKLTPAGRALLVDQ